MYQTTYDALEGLGLSTLGGLGDMSTDNYFGIVPEASVEYVKPVLPNVLFRRNVIDAGEGALYQGGSSYAPGLPLMPSSIGLAGLDALVGLDKDIKIPKEFKQQFPPEVQAIAGQVEHHVNNLKNAYKGGTRMEKYDATMEAAATAGDNIPIVPPLTVGHVVRGIQQIGKGIAKLFGLGGKTEAEKRRTRRFATAVAMYTVMRKENPALLFENEKAAKDRFKQLLREVRAGRRTPPKKVWPGFSTTRFSKIKDQKFNQLLNTWTTNPEKWKAFRGLYWGNKDNWSTNAQKMQAARKADYALEARVRAAKAAPKAPAPRPGVPAPRAVPTKAQQDLWKLHQIVKHKQAQDKHAEKMRVLTQLKQAIDQQKAQQAAKARQHVAQVARAAQTRSPVMQAALMKKANELQKLERKRFNVAVRLKNERQQARKDLIETGRKLAMTTNPGQRRKLQRRAIQQARRYKTKAEDNVMVALATQNAAAQAATAKAIAKAVSVGNAQKAELLGKTFNILAQGSKQLKKAKQIQQKAQGVKTPKAKRVAAARKKFAQALKKQRKAASKPKKTPTKAQWLQLKRAIEAQKRKSKPPRKTPAAYRPRQQLTPAQRRHVAMMRR